MPKRMRAWQNHTYYGAVLILLGIFIGDGDSCAKRASDRLMTVTRTLSVRVIVGRLLICFSKQRLEYGGVDVMQAFLSSLSEGTEILLILSIILFAGFIMTRLTNTLNLPKVSGYILAGILIGPCGLDFIPTAVIGHMGFVSDLALAFIAFGVGKFFKKEIILKTGSKIIIITLFEALTAGVFVTLAVKALFHLDWDFALILGAIATATAPASTMMTINQYKAKGEFVNTLLQIVALDDVVCLLAFSIVAAIASGHASGSMSAADVVLPIVYNLLALLLGFFCGYFLSRLLIPARSKDNRLILAIAMLLGISGICAAMNISPLLSCMVFGAAYINLTRDKKLYRQINNFTPPVMSVFFIVSGMNLDLFALTTVGAIGVCYFIVRIIGKYLGTYISCTITKTSRPVRKYMGLALIPQAGVAIGLAFLGERLLPEKTGKLLLTIILSSSVLYEMVGPLCAKIALFMSGSITMGRSGDRDENQEDGENNSESTEYEQENNSDGPEDENGDDSDHLEEEDRKETDDSEMENGNGTNDSDQGNETESDSIEAEDESEASTGAEDKRKRPEQKESEELDSDDVSSELVSHIKEIHDGVDDQEDYDIEREIKPEKPKKTGRKKKHGKKAS